MVAKDLATQGNRAPAIIISDTWLSRNIPASAQVGLNYVAALLRFPFGTTVTILFKVLCALLRKHSSWLIDFAHAASYFKHLVHPHIIRRSMSSEVSFYCHIYYNIGIAAMIYASVYEWMKILSKKIRKHENLFGLDDVIKWKHFPRYWPFVRAIHRTRWIPNTKASDAELWCFLWSASKQTVE